MAIYQQCSKISGIFAVFAEIIKSTLLAMAEKLLFFNVLIKMYDIPPDEAILNVRETINCRWKVNEKTR